MPFTKSVEWAIPGKPLYYATAMPRRTGALPLVVSTVDGRPIKIEGNPLHPASGGATDAFAQASILDLYDPARSQHFIEHVRERRERREEARRRKCAIARPSINISTNLRTRAAADGGAGLAFLVEETHSPTRERLRARAGESFPEDALVPVRSAPERGAEFRTQISFGDNSRLVPRFERADVILSLGSDFLDCGEGDIAALARLRFAAPGHRRQGHDEPALRGRESLHAHRRDGGSSAALSGEPDSGVHSTRWPGRSRPARRTRGSARSSARSRRRRTRCNSTIAG